MRDDSMRTVRAVAWGRGDDVPHLENMLIVGRAEIRYASGGLFHALLVDVSMPGEQPELRAVYWNRDRDAFVTVELNA